MGHVEVTLRMIRRHAPLIGPEKMDDLPGNAAPIGWAGQKLVQPPRCRTAGQRDAEPTARTRTGSSQPHKFIRRRAAQRFEVGIQTKIGAGGDTLVFQRASVSPNGASPTCSYLFHQRPSCSMSRVASFGPQLPASYEKTAGEESFPHA